MRLRFAAATILVALSCGGGGRPATDRPAPTTTEQSAAEIFASCKVREQSVEGGVEHFIECATGSFQVLTVTDAGVLGHPDGEILDLAAGQSGQEVGRGTLRFAGGEHAIRRYQAGEPGAARPALAGLVAIHREAKRLLVLHCISHGHLGKGIGDDECARALGAIVRDGISPAMVAATAAAEAGATIDIDGMALDMPSCRRAGEDNVKCENGQLSWRAAPELAQAEAFVASEGDRLTTGELMAQGARVESDARPACTFLDRPASCRQLDLYLGSQALGTLRVFLISTRTKSGALFAACSYFPDRESNTALPLPCSAVMKLTP